MRIKRLIGSFVVFLFLLACSKGEVYHRFYPIRNNSWAKEVPVEFSIDSLPAGSGRSCDIVLELVHNSQYPYRNIWFIVQQNLTDTLFVTDTVEITLADPQGKWLGRGSSGLYQLSLPYKRSLPLDSARSYQLIVTHAMKEGTIKGIEKVGILIK